MAPWIVGALALAQLADPTVVVFPTTDATAGGRARADSVSALEARASADGLRAIPTPSGACRDDRCRLRSAEGLADYALLSSWVETKKRWLGLVAECTLTARLVPLAGPLAAPPAVTATGPCGELPAVAGRLGSLFDAAPAAPEIALEACGADADAALAELSRRLLVRVEVRAEERASASRTGDASTETSAVAEAQTIESAVPELTGTRTERRGETTCVELPRPELVANVRSWVTQARACGQARASADAAAHRRCLVRTRLAATWCPKVLEAGACKDLPLLLEAAERRPAQTLRFTTATAGAKVLIEGIGELPVNADVPVPVGALAWSASAPGFCPATGTVEVPAGEARTERVELAAAPELVLTTADDEVVLEIDGQTLRPGERRRLTRCEGRAHYRLSYSDGQSEGGAVELGPGRVLDVAPTHPRVRTLAGSFTDGALLRGTYGLGVGLGGGVDAPLVHQFRADLTWAHGALRYGFGAAYGYSAGDIHQVEGFGRIGAQLTRFGDEYLHLGQAVVLVPYVAVDLGFGHHAFRPGGASAGDFGDFVRSWVLARGEFGVALGLTEGLSLWLAGSYNLTMEQPLALSTGVAVRLP